MPYVLKASTAAPWYAGHAGLGRYNDPVVLRWSAKRDDARPDGVPMRMHDLMAVSVTYHDMAHHLAAVVQPLVNLTYFGHPGGGYDHLLEVSAPYFVYPSDARTNSLWASWIARAHVYQDADDAMADVARFHPDFRKALDLLNVVVQPVDYVQELLTAETRR